jgi:amino acid transporter
MLIIFAVNITTVAGLIGWVVIGVTYLRFYYAMQKQGIARDCKKHETPPQTV